MKQHYADMLTFSDSIEDILRVFAAYTPAFRQVG